MKMMTVIKGKHTGQLVKVIGPFSTTFQMVCTGKNGEWCPSKTAYHKTAGPLVRNLWKEETLTLPDAVAGLIVAIGRRLRVLPTNYLKLEGDK